MIRYYACGNCRMGTTEAEIELNELRAKIHDVLTRAEHLSLDDARDRQRLESMLVEALT